MKTKKLSAFFLSVLLVLTLIFGTNNIPVVHATTITYTGGTGAGGTGSGEAGNSTVTVNAGNFVLIHIAIYATSTTVSSFTLGAANAILLAGPVDQGSNVRSYLYRYMCNVSLGTVTATLTLSGSVYHAWTLAIYSGVQAINPYSGYVSNTGSGTTPATGTVAVTVSGNLVVSGGAFEDTSTGAYRIAVAPSGSPVETKRQGEFKSGAGGKHAVSSEIEDYATTSSRTNSATGTSSHSGDTVAWVMQGVTLNVSTKVEYTASGYDKILANSNPVASHGLLPSLYAKILMNSNPVRAIALLGSAYDKLSSSSSVSAGGIGGTVTLRPLSEGTYTNFSEVVNSNQIWSNQFEEGDLTSQSYFTYSSGGTGSATAYSSGSHHGTYCAKVVTSSGYYYCLAKNVSSMPIAYVRGYVKLSTIPTNGQQLIILELRQIYTSTTDRIGAELYKTGGNLYWGIRVGATFYPASTPTNVSANVYQEIKLLRDNTNNIETLWVNGTQQITKNIALSTDLHTILLRTQIINPDAATTNYFDCLVISSSNIASEDRPDLVNDASDSTGVIVNHYSGQTVSATTLKESSNLNTTSQTGSITSVVLHMRAMTTTAGTDATVFLIKTSGWYESSANTLTASFAEYTATYNDNPNGSDWTWSAVNALQEGVRCSTIASSHNITVSDYWLTINYGAAGAQNYLGSGYVKLSLIGGIIGQYALLRTVYSKILSVDNLVATLSVLRDGYTKILLSSGLTSLFSFSRGFGNTLGLFSNFVRQIASSFSISNTLGLIANAVRHVSLAGALGNTIGLFSSLAAGKGFAQFLSNIINLFSNPIRHVALASSLGNTLGLISNVARQVVLARALSNTLGLFSHLTGSRLVSMTLSNTLGLFSNVVRKIALTSSLGNTLGLFSHIAAFKSISYSLGELMYLLSNGVKEITFIKTLSNTLGLFSTPIRRVTLIRSFIDTVHLYDHLIASTFAKGVGHVSDILHLSDYVSIVHMYARNLFGAGVMFTLLIVGFGVGAYLLYKKYRE